jgi:dihydrofolate reductase
VTDAVSRLRAEVDGDVVVYGSIRLARTLLERGLVDEVRLLVFPVVLGAGARLFGATDAPRALRLARARSGDGVAFLTYVPAPD